MSMISSKIILTLKRKKDEIKQLLKVAKSFKIPPTNKDRITYILFNGIFTVNIAKEITKNKAIIEEFYDALEMENKELDFLLNLEDFLFVRNKEVEYEKYVPTILKLIYDEDLLTEEFLLAWEEGKYEEQCKTDFRYSKEIDEKLKLASKPILDWLKSSD